MPAFKTFSDDPLRILRVIRFGTRYNYQLDQEIKDAVKMPDIKEAFSKKITKERIGVELEKMLTGADPVAAVRILLEFGYYDAVFEFPKTLYDLKHENQSSVLELTTILHSIIHKSSILKEWSIEKFGFNSIVDKELEKRMYLACCIAPYIGMYTKATKSRDIPLGKWMIQNSIKLSNQDADLSSTMVEMSGLIKEWVLKNVESTPTYRRDLGLFIRRLGNIKCLGNYWPFGILFSMVLEIRESFASAIPSEINLKDPNILEIASKYKVFMDGICNLSLEKIHSEKHLLDGKAVSQALNLRPGPTVGKYLDQVMAWQLENPGADEKECLYWLTSPSRRSLI